MWVAAAPAQANGRLAKCDNRAQLLYKASAFVVASQQQQLQQQPCCLGLVAVQVEAIGGKMRRNSCAITFILFRILLWTSV
ncbi:unnamed protein product [Ceratitis capitata]|uniref:(Mediterranean fruit fly) hypothetical protein n=1 Tax=Ceratitis capitata TaxID=7213 RepID=A0A811U5L7_CERCA|nr:unnamed protein product [Ceratitis capitata]